MIAQHRFVEIWKRLSLAATIVLTPLAADGRTGEQIYLDQCASCHGKRGEGVAEKHDEPLYGEKSLKSLVRLIERTMPEDKPGTCVGEDAQKVAAYIYDAFYSPAARSKLAPVRVELSRLTALQYQNNVADLLESFSGRTAPNGKPGLEGTYYASRDFKSDQKKLDRIDPAVAFDYGDSSPDTNHFKVEEFSVRWRGSLIAEDTGEYEFRIRTQNGARLYINDEQKPLIDGWVSSGNEPREQKETIRLLGGRVYPIKIDFFKFKEKTSSILVEWRPPNRTWEVLGEQNLRTGRARHTYVVETPFPPDDSSAGYARGTMVSKDWDKAATYAALETASHVTENLDRFAGTKKDAPDRAEKVRKFCEEFVERAFRRPLTEDIKRAFIGTQFEEEKEIEKAAKRVVLLALKSPRFLYPELPGSEPDAFTVASRLSFALWDSMPDQELLAAAAKGGLRNEGEVIEQARRMLKDARARAKIREFFHHWLKMEEGEDISKDPAAFPDFTDHLLADLRHSLELFIENVVWSEKSDYRELLLADYLFLNSRLARFYGANRPAPASSQGASEEAASSGSTPAQSPAYPKLLYTADAFEKTTVEKRTGVLTHPYLLSIFAYYKSSSPIHRGVFLTRNIVGRALKPPPAAIQFMDGRFDPKMTMREKVTELTSPNACQGCHTIINPLGFSLENFDGVGRYRLTENEKPIDATGEYLTEEGEPVKISGARDVAEYAAASAEGHRAFVRQLFQHTAKQSAQAYGPDMLETLRTRFTEDNFHIQNLMVEIARVAALAGLQPQEKLASN